MTQRLSAPDALLALAIETLRAELLPALSAEHRYTGAMVVNALEIARREILTDGEAAQWALLDRAYDDGEGSLDMLARDIRSGTINDRDQPWLRDGLRALLLQELSVRNPKAVPSTTESR